MSIRAIALELYRAQQKVNRLENEMENAPPQEKDRIHGELQLALGGDEADAQDAGWRKGRKPIHNRLGPPAWSLKPITGRLLRHHPIFHNPVYNVYLPMSIVALFHFQTSNRASRS